FSAQSYPNLCHSIIKHQSVIRFSIQASLGHNDPGTLYTASGLIGLADSDPFCVLIFIGIIKGVRRSESSDMQAELLSLREQQRRARQPGPEARIPDHQDPSGDTDSHI
ncbi:hypothetical protein Tco_1535831, partial [Tanacetum coccineum]